MNIVGEIPQELKNGVEGLDNPTRWNIIEALLANNELSYSEIQDMVQISNGQLTYHLELLHRAGLVQQFSIDRFERGRSFYKLSTFAWSLLKGMMRSFTPVAAGISVTIHSPSPSEENREYPTRPLNLVFQ